MPKSDYQKARLFAVYQILKRYTDEKHGITMSEILNRLEKDYGITSTRQTITGDLDLLEYPLNIECDTFFDKPKKYSLVTRDLSFEDISKIIESINSNALISKADKRRMTKTIQENLCSVYEAKEIQLKAMPLEMDIPSLDIDLLEFLKDAIENKEILDFDYPLVGYCFRNPPYSGGAPYDCQYSDTAGKVRIHWCHYDYALPLCVFTVKNREYLCACYVTSHYNRWLLSTSPHKYFSWSQSIQCFDLAYIKNLSISASTDGQVPLPNSEAIEEAISKNITSIFVSRNEEVVIEFEHELYLFALNYFQEKLNIVKESKKTFQVRQNVDISPDFFSWLFSLGYGAKLLSPNLAVRQMKHWVDSLSELYQSSSNSK